MGCGPSIVVRNKMSPHGLEQSILASNALINAGASPLGQLFLFDKEGIDQKSGKLVSNPIPAYYISQFIQKLRSSKPEGYSVLDVYHERALAKKSEWAEDMHEAIVRSLVKNRNGLQYVELVRKVMKLHRKGKIDAQVLEAAMYEFLMQLMIYCHECAHYSVHRMCQFKHPLSGCKYEACHMPYTLCNQTSFELETFFGCVNGVQGPFLEYMNMNFGFAQFAKSALLQYQACIVGMGPKIHDGLKVTQMIETIVYHQLNGYYS